MPPPAIAEISLTAHLWTVHRLASALSRTTAADDTTLAASLMATLPQHVAEIRLYLGRAVDDPDAVERLGAAFGLAAEEESDLILRVAARQILTERDRHGH